MSEDCNKARTNSLYVAMNTMNPFTLPSVSQENYPTEVSHETISVFWTVGIYIGGIQTPMAGIIDVGSEGNEKFKDRVGKKGLRCDGSMLDGGIKGNSLWWKRTFDH